MKSLNEDELKSLMRTDSYSNSFNPEYKKTQNIVKQGFKNLYPDDDRNIHPDKYYVWNTQGDGRVREAHAERQGEVFSWDNPPEGGHPGQDYGCRCTAEEYMPPKRNRIQEINERLAEIEEQLADIKEDRNHRFLELDDIDNEITIISGSLGLVGVNGILDGVIDVTDIKGGRVDFDYHKTGYFKSFKNFTNELILAANVGKELYENRELIQRLEVLIKERENLTKSIAELNDKINLLEEEKQKLLQEREELER